MTHRLTTLPNGARIVTERIDGFRSATLGLWVTRGCRHETEAENGIAHFLEHMAFKGTSIRSALQIAEEIESVGGYINAYTSRDMTAYYARVLAPDVPLGVDVITDIVLNPVFDPREIEVERGVILSEIGQSFDTPDDIIFDWLQETAFPNQPMGRPILGPSEHVRRFSRDDFAQFVSRNYTASNLIFAAAGAVDHERIVELAGPALDDLPAAPAPDAVPARFDGGEFRRDKDLEQAHFALALPGPSYRDPDTYTAQVHSGVLGGGMSSRLFQELREELGLCYSVFSQAASYEDAGTLMVYAGTSSDKIGELAEVTLDIMRKLPATMTEAEVARARAQMKAGTLMALESASARAERLARSLAVWGRVPDLDETIARIDAVGLEQTRDYAARIAASRPALALYGPIAATPAYNSLVGRLGLS